eukprot:84094-Pyramimonas_sp.AAC.1
MAERTIYNPVPPESFSPSCKRGFRTDEAGEGSPVVWLTTEDEAAESGELEAKNTKDGLPY